MLKRHSEPETIKAIQLKDNRSGVSHFARAPLSWEEDGAETGAGLLFLAGPSWGGSWGPIS